jgi:hypothetical protein
MAPAETVTQGILKADGTLELDEKPDLPAGRVMVVLRPISPAPPASGATPASEDPFWQRMLAMWAIPVSPANADGGANTLAEVRKMREEWDEHQEALEKCQEEARIAPKPAAGSEP